MIPADAPAASVVIATHGRSRFFALQLAALARQETALPFEVIVADNGCTDGALACVADFTDRLDLRVVDATARRGRSYARNQGARAARGPALLFLDHDDEASPGYVDAMARALIDHPVVGGHVDYLALNPPWLVRSQTRPSEPEAPLPGTPRWNLGASLGVTRAAFDAVRGFDEDLLLCFEDIDICWRLHRLGYEMDYVPDAVLHYRLRERGRDMLLQKRMHTVGVVRFGQRHPGLVVEPVTLGGYLRYAGGSLLRAAVGTTPQARATGWSGLGTCVGHAETVLRRRVLRS